MEELQHELYTHMQKNLHGITLDLISQTQSLRLGEVMQLIVAHQVLSTPFCDFPFLSAVNGAI